jgi:3-phenylpropionate/trans-cinnamate dioxygenase ferredoxin subunit
VPEASGRFDCTTGTAQGPPVLVDLRTYPTKVTDGVVYIEVD